MDEYRFGAWPREDGTQFYVWSDKAAEITVRWTDERSGRSGELQLLPEIGDPYVHAAFEPRLGAGALYELFIDGERCVDPYARSLPQGVHGPVEIVAPLPPLQHEKRRIELEHGAVFYELHVGTFTAAGTFAAAAERLPRLAELGVTAIELMPIASFAGARGWGYDGVALMAPFAPYGTVAELRTFLETAHELGLSVVLDVVYNHLGPDGNYLPQLSDSYFHHERENAWGKAPALEAMAFRSLVLASARYWLEDVGFDGLRIDAAHELEPGGDPHILQGLAGIARNCTPPAVLIAEDDRNTPVVLYEYGIDAVWSDDFHHCVHTLITGEREGYYAAYDGNLEQLARVIERGQIYEGQVFPPTGKARGVPVVEVPRHRLVYSLQNHDQVGNRALGERLYALCSPERYHAALLLLLFLPATPMLFMGDEVLTTSPFLYFTDYSGDLGQAITEGRRKEFENFSAFRDGGGNAVPDPQSEATFQSSKVNWDEERGRSAFELSKRALALRREDPVLNAARVIRAGVSGAVLYVVATNTHGRRVLAFNLGPEIAIDQLGGESAAGSAVLLSSSEGANADSAFHLPAESCVIFSVLNEPHEV